MFIPVQCVCMCLGEYVILDLILYLEEYVSQSTHPEFCSGITFTRSTVTLPRWENNIQTNKWENSISHLPDIPKSLIGLMTALLSSSLMAIFTAASFFKVLVLCSIPAYLHPQEYSFPAAVTSIFWDLSLVQIFKVITVHMVQLQIGLQSRNQAISVIRLSLSIRVEYHVLYMTIPRFSYLFLN